VVDVDQHAAVGEQRLDLEHRHELGEAGEQL